MARLATLVPAAVLPLACAAPPAGLDGDGALVAPFGPYPPGAPDVAWFTDVTAESGIGAVTALELDDQLYKGAGVAAADVDGDGRLDLLVGRGAGPATLYLNEGGLRFRASPEEDFAAGIDVRAVALGDLDGDGDPDAVVAGGGALRLMDNTGGGRFTDVTAAAGLDASPDAVDENGILLADLDADGLTDILVIEVLFSFPEPRAGHLYRNRGDGTFEDVWPEVGLAANMQSWVAAAADLDGDDAVDLFFGNDTFTPDSGERPVPAIPNDQPYAPDLLYRRLDDEPRFEEVGAGAGVRENRSNMGVIVADLTGDGHDDLYLSDWGRNELLAGDGAGRFTDVTDELGLGAITRLDTECTCLLVSWGSAAEDLDLDGDRDLIVVNGALPGGDARQPAAAWRQDAPGVFTPVVSGLGWLSGRALVTADLDEDGDLDAVVTQWDGPTRLFRNEAAVARALRVRLRGHSSNPDGLGARVELVTAGGKRQRRTIGTGGIVHSWAPSEAHFGLGDEPVDAIEVVWPSGHRQRVTHDGAAFIEVAEPPLVSVTPRVVPADGTALVDVVVVPSDERGLRLGAGRAIAIEADGGVFTGPVVDEGDGSYRRTLRAPAAPGRIAIAVTIDGTPLLVRPRVEVVP